MLAELPERYAHLTQGCWSAEMSPPDADGVVEVTLLNVEGNVLAAMATPPGVDAARLVGSICALPALLLRAEMAEAEQDELHQLVRDLAHQSDECWRDEVTGYCRAHGWYRTDPCPYQRAQEYLQRHPDPQPKEEHGHE